MDIQNTQQPSIINDPRQVDDDQEFFTIFYAGTLTSIPFNMPFARKPVDHATITIDNFVYLYNVPSAICFFIDNADGPYQTQSQQKTSLITIASPIAQIGSNYVMKLEKGFQTRIPYPTRATPTIDLGMIYSNYSVTKMTGNIYAQYFITFTIGYYYK